MCRPSSGAGGFSGAARSRDGCRHRGSAGFGCRGRRRVDSEEARIRRRCRNYGLAAALDPDLDVTAFQFELGNIFFDQELYEFF